MEGVEDLALLEDLFGRVDLVQNAVGVPLEDLQFWSFLGL